MYDQKLKHLFRSSRRSAIFTTSALAVILGLGGAHATARPGGHGKGRFMGGAMFRALNQLDLSEEQANTLTQMKADMRTRRQEMRLEAKSQMTAIADEFKSGSPDRERVLELFEAQAAQKQELAREFINQMLDFHETLTDSQKSELAETIASRQERFLRDIED